MTRITYRAIHPLALSPEGDARAKTRGLSIDMREESRILSTSKDLHDRLKRWIREVNRSGRANEFISNEALKLIPSEKVGFVPRDQLYLESEGAESVFGSDPQLLGSLPEGTVFHCETVPGQLAANFDLKPFLESYVRRLSAQVPQYVWHIGENYYHRTNGMRLQQDPVRFDARRFPAPKQVVDAFGPLAPTPPLPCAVCGKADDKVVAQPSEKAPQAHGECLKTAGGA